MKNLFVLAAFLLTTLTGRATEIRPTAFAKNVTTVQFNNVKKGHELTIKNATSEILYTESMKSNGLYTQYFDLTTLVNGDYTIELNKDSEILIKYFNVKNGVVSYAHVTENTFFKPAVRLKNNQLFVSQLVSYDEVLDVQIYYNNELIQEDSLSDATILNRIYQLDATKKGNYVVITKSADREFYQHFTL